YRRWLRELGVAYVVLARSPPDYSSRQEAALVRSGRAGLRLVWASPEIAIYAVPRPRPIVTGPGRPTVLALHESRLLVRARQGGPARVAVRWSPYWHASTGCLVRARGGMLLLRTPTATTVRIAFDVDGASLLHAFAGHPPAAPSRSPAPACSTRSPATRRRAPRRADDPQASSSAGFSSTASAWSL